MKKQFLFIVLSLSVVVSALAQKSSVKLQVGYGIPLGNNSLPTVNYSQTSVLSNSIQNGSNYNSSTVSGSLGGGLMIEAGYTYSFAPLISAQVDFTYLAGKQYEGAYVGGAQSSNESLASNFMQVAPMIRFDVGEGKIHPYVAVGPVFGLGNIIYKSSGDYDGTIEEQEMKIDGSVAIGTKSVLGLELTKGNLGFFLQATMVNLSYAPSKAELTKSISNGTDELPNMQTYYKQIEFKSSVSSNGQVDVTQPSQQLQVYYPFSSLSLNLGVRLKL